MAGLAFMVIETAFIVRACNQGLGQHSQALDNDSLEEYFIYFYGASILAIVIEATTKVAICLFIAAISPQRMLLLANNILMGFIGLWAVSGVLAIAFACGLPHPWRAHEGGVCTAQEAIYTYNGIMNIITDLALCILPIVMMWNVQTSLKRKIQVCALFGSRILVVAITIPRLATSGSYYNNIVADPSWYAVGPTILGQISLNLSVLTACIPGLKSVMDNLLSGTAATRIDGGYNLTSSGNKKAPWTITPTMNSRPSQGSGLGGSKSKQLVSKITQRFRPEGSTQNTISVHGGHTNDTKRDSSPGRSESTRNLISGVIMRTDQYEVSSVKRTSIGMHDFASRESGEDAEHITPAHSR